MGVLFFLLCLFPLVDSSLDLVVCFVFVLFLFSNLYCFFVAFLQYIYSRHLLQPRLFQRVAEMEALKLLSQNMLEFSRGLGDILAQADPSFLSFRLSFSWGAGEVSGARNRMN